MGSYDSLCFSVNLGIVSAIMNSVIVPASEDELSFGVKLSCPRV